jgi:hypothetical protein
MVVCVSILTVTPSLIMSQEPTHPFTEDELYQVMRRFLPRSLAREYAQKAVATPAEPIIPPRQDGREGIPFSNEPYVNFIGDTLGLLSLLSPVTREKVYQYRRRFASKSDAVDERLWNERRMQLKQLLDSNVFPDIKKEID